MGIEDLEFEIRSESSRLRTSRQHSALSRELSRLLTVQRVSLFIVLTVTFAFSSRHIHHPSCRSTYQLRRRSITNNTYRAYPRRTASAFQQPVSIDRPTTKQQYPGRQHDIFDSMYNGQQLASHYQHVAARVRRRRNSCSELTDQSVRQARRKSRGTSSIGWNKCTRCC